MRGMRLITLPAVVLTWVGLWGSCGVPGAGGRGRGVRRGAGRALSLQRGAGRLRGVRLPRLWRQRQQLPLLPAMPRPLHAELTARRYFWRFTLCTIVRLDPKQNQILQCLLWSGQNTEQLIWRMFSYYFHRKFLFLNHITWELKL